MKDKDISFSGPSSWGGSLWEGHTCSVLFLLPFKGITPLLLKWEKKKPNNLSSLNTFFQATLNGIFSNYILLKAIDKLTQFPICPFLHFLFPLCWQVLTSHSCWSRILKREKEIICKFTQQYWTVKRSTFHLHFKTTYRFRSWLHLYRFVCLLSQVLSFPNAGCSIVVAVWYFHPMPLKV